MSHRNALEWVLVYNDDQGSPRSFTGDRVAAFCRIEEIINQISFAEMYILDNDILL